MNKTDESNKTYVDGYEDELSVEREDNDNMVRNVITVFIYSVIIIVSLSGNCMVCKLVYSNRKMRTTTNLLIVSLTVSDILTTLLNIPFNCARILLQNWPFSDSMCVIVPLIQVCCVYVSTLTMAVISIYRFYSVTRLSPNQISRYLSTTKLMGIIAMTWVVSLILSVPHAIFNEVVEAPYNNIPSKRCRVIYPDIDFNFPLWLTVEVILTQYLIPLSVTCCLYVRIALIISRQGRLAVHSSDQNYRHYCETKRKRIVMLILVCLTFAISWFPLNCYHLLIDLHIVPHNYTIFLFVHSFAMSSVCYNPIIYCWMNMAFRREAHNLLVATHVVCGTTVDEDAGNEMTANGDESQRIILTGLLEQTLV